MDCEKFESAMMDELYGELDELTSAAAKRHVAGCARCAALLGGLRATRRVASVPLLEPPVDLEQRILSATREVHPVVPLRRRVAQAISLAGSWAMRPQTAMAAVFLVMIGTSVLLLRGKSARAPESAMVTVTEKGSPAPEASAAPEQAALAPAGPATTTVYAQEAKPAATLSTASADLPAPEAHERARALAPSKDDGMLALQEKNATGAGFAAPHAAAPPAPAAAPAAVGGAAGEWGSGSSRSASSPGYDKKAGGASSPFDAALQLYQNGRFDDAARAFDALAASNAGAELWAARSVREGKGCRAALARFDRLAQHASGTAPGWDGLLEGALCYRAIGDFGDARIRLTRLLQVDAYKDRAQAELDRLDRMQAASAPAVRSATKAAARPAPPPSAVDSQQSY